MRMIPATCECGVEFLREPHDTNPRCSECFFTHDVPDLKRLTDEVSEQEKRPGTSRQEDHQAAHTETSTKKESSVMANSTRYSAAMTDMVLEVVGTDADRIIPALTDIRADIIRNRIAGRSVWTVGELGSIADMLGVTPARFVSAVSQVADHGKDIGQAGRDLVRAAQISEVPA